MSHLPSCFHKSLTLLISGSKAYSLNEHLCEDLICSRHMITHQQHKDRKEWLSLSREISVRQQIMKIMWQSPHTHYYGYQTKGKKNKCGWGCGQVGTLWGCWWECKTVRKTVQRFFKKFNIELPSGAQMLLDIHISKRTESRFLKRYLRPHLHSSIKQYLKGGSNPSVHWWVDE